MAGVVSLRETSVIFATAIGALFMGESFGRWRILAAITVAAGIDASVAKRLSWRPDAPMPAWSSPMPLQIALFPSGPPDRAGFFAAGRQRLAAASGRVPPVLLLLLSILSV